MDDKEVATIHKTQAEADQIYMQNGVLDPNEVAKSRFSGDEYTLETAIDTDTRKRQEKLIEKAGKGETKPEDAPVA